MGMSSNHLSLLSLVAWCHSSLAQPAAAEGAGNLTPAPEGQSQPQSPSPPAYRAFRYDEDCRSFADPALRTGLLDGLKYIPLSDSDPDTYLTLSGEARTRYESTRSPGFGLQGVGHNDYVLQCFLVGADLHVTPHFRTFVQLVSGLDGGAELSPPPTQENKFDVQQAFADLLLGNPDGNRFRLRGGRMEMGYGSYRLVSSRDSTNVRLSFDGLRGTFDTERLTVDGFLTRPVQPENGYFDDGQNDGQAFWGLYAALKPDAATGVVVDAYHFGLHRDSATFAAGTADEDRHTVETRLWRKSLGFDYDIEGVFQFGSFGDQGIRAWSVASHVGYTVGRAAWKPRIALKANIASGDADPGDGMLGTFDGLFPKNNYFSEAALLVPSNFFDIHPSIQVRPHETVVLVLDWDPYWRYSADDAVYAPGRIAIPATASDGRYVGSTVSAQVDWTISRYASLSANHTHFFAGTVVDEAGGSDFDFVAVWLTFRI